MVVILGQQYDTGEKPTVMLYTYINRHAGTSDKNKKKRFEYILIYIYIIIYSNNSVSTLIQ